MSASDGLSRRDFIISAAVMGGSLLIGLTLAPAAKAALADDPPWGGAARRGSYEFSPWICIAPDDTVTVRVPTPEIGNGTMTQIPMTVAEELHCDWSKIRAEYAPANRDFREQNVYSTPGGVLAYFSGRSTEPNRTRVLLQVGASARERLKTAAAKHWNVPIASVTAVDSVLTHVPTGRTLRYGEIASKAAGVLLKVEPTPKAPKDWVLLGKKAPGKLTNVGVVNGTAIYGMDVRLPDMLYAALMQSPVHGGKLKHYDFEAIRNMPGVHAVAVVDPSEKRAPGAVALPFPNPLSAPQSAVAVVADHYWQARKALEALPVEWEDGAGTKWKSTQQVYDAAISALDRQGEKINTNLGDALGTLARGGKIVEATYLTPFCDQAPMEPLNGTALVTPDRVEVWHPAQHSQQAFYVAAEEAGVKPEQAYFHQTLVGGAFGRRVFADDVRMVVAVAKKVPGRPVHVIWSREEMMRQGRYRPMQAARFKAVLDAATGLPKAVFVRVAGKSPSSSGIKDSAYANPQVVPHFRVESQTIPLHVMTGSYRGPGYNATAFMMETFINECADAAGVDPLEYRLKLLEKWPDPAWAACLRAAAAGAGWGRKLPKGQGQGIAISNWGMAGKPQNGTTVATAVTVEVTPAGEVKVLQVDVAFDTGTVLNRDAVRAQLEGATLFGINMTLNEELNIENGRIVEGNFNSYPMLRSVDLPHQINVHFTALSGHERICEIGEPGVGPIGPAIGAAIYRATGKRLRATPFRKHDLKTA